VKIDAPRTDSIYTVSYSPLISSQEEGSEVFLTPSKKVWLERYQIVAFDASRPTTTIDHSRMCLQILSRGNTLNTRISPYVREIVLLGG
jgi:hypothetical protein